MLSCTFYNFSCRFKVTRCIIKILSVCFNGDFLIAYNLFNFFSYFVIGNMRNKFCNNFRIHSFKRLNNNLCLFFSVNSRFLHTYAKCFDLLHYFPIVFCSVPFRNRKLNGVLLAICVEFIQLFDHMIYFIFCVSQSCCYFANLVCINNVSIS